MADSFFGGALFDGEFFDQSAPATDVQTPAGSAKRKRVFIREKEYFVTQRELSDLLQDLIDEALEERVEVAAPVKAKQKKPETVEEVEVAEAQEYVPQIDWSPIRQQLALQDTHYVDILDMLLRNREEDDIEILLLH